MKSRVQHLVPLSRQALALLKALRPLSGHSPFLFPSTRSPRKPIHGQALSQSLRKCGFLSTEVTPHGFRATACTLLNELGWNSDAIERQLAHGASDDLRRIYNYAQYLPMRRLMMQAWADYLDELRLSAQHERTARDTSTSRPNTSSELLTAMIGYPTHKEEMHISYGLRINGVETWEATLHGAENSTPATAG